ncbi:MAG TPA: hypothetical protein VHD63_20455 [Ktedonobacteraceae bacterium]|jgi:hypothetical protein|nr:hypothetical protein [Ktedonobacteraceae bacterium]
MLTRDSDEKEPTPLDDEKAPLQRPGVLYITLGPDGAFKAGTCAHCVIEERGRPGRAWDADGDNELDFARDTLFAHLADLGVVLINRKAYICP